MNSIGSTYLKIKRLQNTEMHRRRFRAQALASPPEITNTPRVLEIITPAHNNSRIFFHGFFIVKRNHKLMIQSKNLFVIEVILKKTISSRV